MLPKKGPDDDLTPKIREQIDENLKRAYDQVLTENIPDRFHELLAKLGKMGDKQ